MTKNVVDDIYLLTAEQIVDLGVMKDDRTKTGTISLFAQQMAFDLTGGKLPLLTTKKLHLTSIIHELIWFLRGESNIAYLKEHGVRIWDEWADENGDLGPVYGVQWRKWDDTRVIQDSELAKYKERGFEVIFGDWYAGMVAVSRKIDQIADLLHQLRTNPDSRRLILTAWNPSVVEEQALPPCHSFVQFYTRELSFKERSDIARERVLLKVENNAELDDSEYVLAKSGHLENIDDTIPEELLEGVVPATRGISCHLYQRSGDFFLGVPFNIASYSLLTHMLAKCVGMEPLEFVHTIGDAHLYSNHLDQINEQMSREGVDCTPIVTLLGEYNDPAEFNYYDINIYGYESEAVIKAPVAV
ncbi:thymidylate synthase [Halomonas sp. BMC6]|uniref:thymidylate synthase n=1 Tax=Halomonas sp. BMC6 TaxID=3073244 RepID=UPI0030D59B02